MNLFYQRFCLHDHFEVERRERERAESEKHTAGRICSYWLKRKISEYWVMVWGKGVGFRTVLVLIHTTRTWNRHRDLLTHTPRSRPCIKATICGYQTQDCLLAGLNINWESSRLRVNGHWSEGWSVIAMTRVVFLYCKHLVFQVFHDTTLY